MATIHLSDHFTYSRLWRFALPTIFMMIITSIYTVVDGLFVANFVGPTAFGAVNFTTPIIMLIGCIGFMFGSGGSALVAKLLGEHKRSKANKVFSLLTYTNLILGTLLTLMGIYFLQTIIDQFHIAGELKQNSLAYGYIVLLGTIPLILQFYFHPFLITAERPMLGLIITLIAGVSNIILDALFLIYWNMGIFGAAWATVVSTVIGGISPLIFFMLPNKTSLHIGQSKWDLESLLKATGNGLSEFLSHISMSLVIMLFNYQLLKYAGEDGIVAFGVIASTNFLFMSLFIGYSLGTGSIVSYHYGAQNYTELKNILGKNLHIFLIMTISLTLLAELFAEPISGIFLDVHSDVGKLAINGFKIFVLAYLLSGYNIYASAFFTALNNGLVSAIISVSRTLIFQSLCVLILPIFFGINGVWSAMISAEFLTIILSLYFILKLRNKYHYL